MEAGGDVGGRDVGGRDVGGRDVGVGIGRGRPVRMETCGGCGKEMRAGNLARHQRGACRVGTREGGQTPDGGRRHKWMDGNEHPFEVLEVLCVVDTVIRL